MIEYKAAFYEDRENRWFLTKARSMLHDALREMTEWLLEDGQSLPHSDSAVSDPSADVIEPIRLIIRVQSGAAAP